MHVLKEIDIKLITFISAGAVIVLSAFALKNRLSGRLGKNMSAFFLYVTKWSLKKIYRAAVMEEVNAKAFIKFNRQKKSAGENGNCNMFGRNFSVNKEKIGFKNIFSTKMYCEVAQQQEDLFFKQLEKVNRFEIKGEILKLYQDKELLSEFESSSE